MSEQNPKQTEILQLIRERFAFLKTEKGFTKPIIHTSLDHFIYRNDVFKLMIQIDLSFQGTVNIELEKLVPSEHPARDSWNLLGFLTRRLHIQDKRIEHLIQIMRQHRLAGAPFPRVDLDQDRPFIIEQIECYQHLLSDYIDTILKQPLDILFPSDLEFLPFFTVTNQIEQYIIDQFKFLHHKGFAQEPVVFRSDFTWLNQRLGVRIGWDFRDGDIGLSLVLLKQDEPMFRKPAKKYDDPLNIERTIWSLRDIASRLHLPAESWDLKPQLPQFYFWTSEYDYAHAIAEVDAYCDWLKQHIDTILEQPLETLFAK